MRRGARKIAVMMLVVAAQAGGVVWGDTLTHGGLAGASPTYGYNPYKKFYGPCYAQRELDHLTYQPGVHGLDYGYGIGYWFGFGPPKQYRHLPHQQKQLARCKPGDSGKCQF